MKTTKRVIAIVLAALMLAMAIPFAVSAATTKEYSFTLKCAKPGYEFTVYPLATIDDTTGAYTAVNTVTDNAVKAEINASKADTQALMEACQVSTGIGSGLADKFTSSDTTTTKTYKQLAGIYFFKVTGVPITNTDVLGGAIIVLDKNVTEVDLSNKVKEGNEPTVDKDFSVNNSLTKDTQTFGTGDTITYVLTADVPGSFTNQLTQYIITDTMGTGLEKTVHDVTSVELFEGSTKKGNLTYDVTTSAAEIGATATFGVKLKAAELAKESFYGTGKKVVVTYTTRLAADAPIATDIPNTDGLIYTNAGGSKTVPGPTVYAKTYKIVAKKIDAQTNQPVGGATFTLTYPDGTTKKTAVSDATTGIADFGVLLKAGTYTVQETKEPNGYTINTKVETVTVGDATTGDVTVTISDTKTKTPNTGGAGTMMFTIIGGSLVLLAGALFVVVMKKRSSK
ncbi:MAG: SpaA isopeptide-forming pilin-related protein [Oscillospiraceae bacterium]|nr:SpaA isopeptide-forming pilin-related protein [Oscillospiraceae bacterium]